MHKPLVLRRSVQSIAYDGGLRRLESELKSRQVSLLLVGGTIGDVGGQQKYLTKVSPHADCAGARVGGGGHSLYTWPPSYSSSIVNDFSSAVGTRGTHMHAHPVWHGVSRRTVITLDGLGRWANDWTWKVAGQATRSSLACEQDTRPTCGSAEVTRNQRGGTHPGKSNDSSFSRVFVPGFQMAILLIHPLCTFSSATPPPWLLPHNTTLVTLSPIPFLFLHTLLKEYQHTFLLGYLSSVRAWAKAAIILYLVVEPIFILLCQRIH